MSSDISDIDPLEFHYHFVVEGGETIDFTVRLDEHNLALMREKRENYPDWTRLEYHKCPNCPLKESEHQRCPAATGVADVVERFRKHSSQTPVEVTITSANRTFHKRAPLSTGLGALMGLHMATSGCPVLDKLRPMTRTHLPFATYEETMYRMLSMYLLAQYFQEKNGGNPDWKFDKLKDLLSEIRTVNKAFCERVKQPGSGDAVVNAMVLLDCFAGITELSLKKANLGLIERTFQAYLEKRPEAK